MLIFTPLLVGCSKTKRLFRYLSRVEKFTKSLWKLMKTPNLHWHEIVDELSLIVIIVDEADRVIYCNAVALEALGYIQSEIVGNPFPTILLPHLT